MTAIECRSVTKSYAGRQALRGLDLAVPSGAVVGFLGPNGAGKTTAIRILSTVLTPDSGTFSVAGEPSDQPVAIRRRIGVLPESAGFADAQTGEEVVTFHARLHGQSTNEAKATARRSLNQVGLGDRAQSRVAGYSRGMRQRLGIARALVNRPAVVFLDEPTLGLDPAGQRDVLELIGSISRETGATVVLSTHLLAEVEEVCARAVILNKGRVVADGTVDEIINRVAAPREGRLRVPRDRVDAAVAALSSLSEFETVRRADAPDDLVMQLREGVTAETIATRLSRALLEHDIPMLELAFERARLSDAFLALTAES